MQEHREQMSLDLQPMHPFALSYFVSHSGIAEAFTAIAEALEEVQKDPKQFRLVYVHGPHGSGKTHLICGWAEEALKRGISENSICTLELDGGCACLENRTSSIVSEFERLKAGGGIMLAASRSTPTELTSNPHILSRLSWGLALEVAYPGEEELRPLLLSLSERRNLRLSERSLEYLLRRLPMDPLSFDSIFTKISELSLTRSGPAGFRVVREALSGVASDKSV